MSDPPLEEQHDGYTARWECEPPPDDSTFLVHEEEWDLTGDRPVRILRHVQVVELSIGGGNVFPGCGNPEVLG